MAACDDLDTQRATWRELDNQVRADRGGHSDSIRAMKPFRDRQERPEAAFAPKLLEWFAREGRHDLPWTRHPTPYRVWVSEIMLQQTQVATVVPYFARFIERFPNISTLAAAPEDAVLAAWTGLGYYRRARNLWRAAREIEQHYCGELPGDPEELQKLPGIGRSTAGAIAALAFGKRATILDGNVKRVLARVHNIDEWPGATSVEARLWSLAEDLTPMTNVARYTQAIMDLGATLCTRRRPDCPRCPVNDDCSAFQEQRVEQCPAPRPKRSLPERTLNMIVLEDESGRILLRRRPRKGVWGGLWCFPEHTDDTEPVAYARALLDSQNVPAGSVIELAPPPSMRHQFTHFRLTINFTQWQVVATETRSVREPGPESAVPSTAANRQGAQTLDTQAGPQASPKVPPAPGTSNGPAAGADAGEYGTWFAVDEARAVGLAAPVVRYLAQPAAEKESNDG